MPEYFKKLQNAKDRVVAELERRGVKAQYLQFGGPGEVPGRVFVPADARSEFLANRAMGDWAEQLAADAITSTLPRYRAVRYGNSDRMAAGDEGFGAFYRDALEEVRVFGKRPDLLIEPKSYRGPDDLSARRTEELRPVVDSALAAIEIRSSKFDALHYARVRAKERELAPGWLRLVNSDTTYKAEHFMPGTSDTDTRAHTLIRWRGRGARVPVCRYAQLRLAAR